MAHLTTPDNVRKNVRPVSGHLDDNRIEIYIDEAEQLNVKPRIGDALFIDLLDYVVTSDQSQFPSTYKILMYGGNYERTICGKTEKKTFKGLQLTLEYYVYAKLVKNNDNNVTRFGLTNKDDDYSSRPDIKIKLVAEKDALSVADGYMSDCIDFLKANTDTITLFSKAGKAKNRLRISIIGN